MSIKEQENLLFEEWKKSIPLEDREHFVTDGIVNEEKWNTAKVKILFLLKEVNGGDGEWDERDYLLKYITDKDYKNAHSQSIDSLIRWAYGLLIGNKNVCWTDVNKAIENTNIQTELLSQIALVNIKKTYGSTL